MDLVLSENKNGAKLERMMEPLLSVQEVAAILNVSACTVYRLKDRLEGPRAYKVAGCVRFKPEDVAKYIESRAVKKVQTRQQSYCRHRFRYEPGMRVV